jgi:hypothetical protein
VWQAVKEEINHSDASWLLLRRGLFHGSKLELQAAFEVVDQVVSRVGIF